MRTQAPTRLTKLSQQEHNWISALCRSGLDLTTPFTSQEACMRIRDVPTNKAGKQRTILPNKTKFNYTLRKSPLFECVRKSVRGSKKPNLWRYKE